MSRKGEADHASLFLDLLILLLVSKYEEDNVTTKVYGMRHAFFSFSFFRRRVDLARTCNYLSFNLAVDGHAVTECQIGLHFDRTSFHIFPRNRAAVCGLTAAFLICTHHLFIYSCSNRLPVIALNAAPQ